jgi:hypothetical protein
MLFVLLLLSIVLDRLFNLFKKVSLKDTKGAGDMAQLSRALAVLINDLGLVHSTHMVTTVGSFSSREN